VIPKKIKDQKTERVREKRKARMKFNLRIESPGKFSTKNSGQGISREKKKEKERKERRKKETKGKS
jgi:hypothetical protein